MHGMYWIQNTDIIQDMNAMFNNTWRTKVTFMLDCNNCSFRYPSSMVIITTLTQGTTRGRPLSNTGLTGDRYRSG